jgi:hypothetical protein
MGMGLLGEMLVERGDISVEQLHTGLAACRRGRWRLGSCLVHYGFIEEELMLEALADQLGVPFVSEPMLFEFLESLDAGVLPRSMLRQLRVIPFRMMNDRIQVAMSDPGDAGVIDHIANFTQLHVEPFIASDRTIEMAIDRAQSYAPPEAADEDLLTDVVLDEDATGSWEDLWAPRLDPDLLLRIRSRPKAAGIVLVASYPSLATVGAVEGKAGGARIDSRELARLLGNALTVGEIGEILMHYGAQRLDRVCLFAIHRGKISGWMSRGLPLDSGDFQSFSVFADVPSIFSELEGRDCYQGVMPGGPVNDQILRLLGWPAPTEVVVAPVVMAGRPKVYLLGDIPTREIPESSRGELVSAARGAGEALGTVLQGRV